MRESFIKLKNNIIIIPVIVIFNLKKEIILKINILNKTVIITLN